MEPDNLGNVIATSLVMPVFLSTTSVVYLFLMSSYTNRSFDASAVSAGRVSRVKSGIQFNSTAQSNGGLCDDYTVQVENTGKVLVGDFREVDLIVERTPIARRWLTR